MDSIVIDMSDWAKECQLCGKYDYLDFCIPFYEEPRPDLEIGDQVPGGGPDDIVGGMSCCGRCWAYHQVQRSLHEDHHGGEDG